MVTSNLNSRMFKQIKNNIIALQEWLVFSIDTKIELNYLTTCQSGLTSKYCILNLHHNNNRR